MFNYMALIITTSNACCMKYLEMLKTLKIEVPEMKETISTIQDHVKEANNRFLPLWTKLSETQDKEDLYFFPFD
jgi:hypothetical protein